MQRWKAAWGIEVVGYLPLECRGIVKHWWLMSAILATWEAATGRIVFESA
jgi:hypothetical protein